MTVNNSAELLALLRHTPTTQDYDAPIINDPRMELDRYNENVATILGLTEAREEAMKRYERDYSVRFAELMNKKKTGVMDPDFFFLRTAMQNSREEI